MKESSANALRDTCMASRNSSHKLKAVGPRIAMAAVIGVTLASCDQSSSGQKPQAGVATPNAIAPVPKPDPRIAYELREKCGQDAREWFKHFYGDGVIKSEKFEGNTRYSNHYNIEQNRCFALITTTGFSHRDKSKGIMMSDDRQLVDVSENKTIADFFEYQGTGGPLQCSLEEKECSSKAEWEQLTARYMQR